MVLGMEPKLAAKPGLNYLSGPDFLKFLSRTLTVSCGTYNYSRNQKETWRGSGVCRICLNFVLLLSNTV